MHAIVDRDGRLSWQRVPDPVPAAGEALLEVHATALNRADLAQRAGRYPPPPGASAILGLEAAGVVLEGGGESFPAGTPACALLAGGGYAELAAVPRQLLMPLPRSWSQTTAAAFPEAFFTGYLNLFMLAGLQPGGTVLIHGGASGVGTAAIAMAAEAGCRVFATAGSAEKVALCRELGAELAVDYKRQDFAALLADHLGRRGLDVVLDIVGGPYLARNLELLAPGGRVVVISTLGGALGEVDLGLLMRRRASLHGSVLRSRSVAEKARIKAELWHRFGEALRQGRLVPRIDSVMPIARAEEAHRRMRSNLNLGKIVLQVR